MLKTLKIDWKYLAKSLFPATAPKVQSVTVGVDYSHSQITAIELTSKPNHCVMSRFVSAPLPQDEKLLAKRVGELIEKAKFSASKINIALFGPIVLTRFIQFPKMDRLQLKNAMRYEIEKYIPFQADDVIFDFHVLGNDDADKKTMKLILVAAKKTEIYSLIETFQKANLKVQGIDIHAFACLNAFNFSQPPAQPGETSVLVDIGKETSSFMVVKDREPVFIREISIGFFDILENFKKKIEWDETQKKTFELVPLVKVYREDFQESVVSIASQLRLSMDFFLNNNATIPQPKGLYLSGELSSIEEFLQQINKIMGLPGQTWDCLQGIELGEQISKSDLENCKFLLPACLGLALRKE